MGASATVRCTWEAMPASNGGPSSRSFRTSREFTSCPIWSRSATAPPSRASSTLVTSSPGTARFRACEAALVRRPTRPPPGRRTSPASSWPFPLPSTIANGGGSPGAAITGCGTTTRAARASWATGLSAWPAAPCPTKPPDPAPARNPSPTATRRPNRGLVRCGVAAGTSPWTSARATSTVTPAPVRRKTGRQREGGAVGRIMELLANLTDTLMSPSFLGPLAERFALPGTLVPDIGRGSATQHR